MQTVDKAVKLLNLFSVEQPEVGLSDLARRAGYDKAATRRLLVALKNHEFIEQNPDNRRYRLGPGFLHLARVREVTQPLVAVLQPALSRLTDMTGETAHASLMSDNTLSTISICFPDRGNRAHLELGETLPLHATASGIAVLAFSPGNPLKMLPDTLSAFTEDTLLEPHAVSRLVAAARDLGVAVMDSSYCSEITGIAVPYFSASGSVLGSIAVATPNSRMSERLSGEIRKALMSECAVVTRAIGGQIPVEYRAFVNR